ncbi:MAG: GAF domain-containing protein [Balneolaceae bacterium]|nr:GAF domain-containing protein [Balneolaceae bacterium]
MKSYAEARQKDRSNAEIMGQKRQEKALREFKQVLKDLLFLLRNSSEMETCYLYWVNRSREQFVLETKATVLSNVMFQDRVQFEDHFLDDYKDIEEPVTLSVGDDIASDNLIHYYDEVPIRHLTLLPFINNGETVALTVLESSDHSFSEDQSEVIHSYVDALRNMLNTYLEISDLYEKQEEWVDYETSLDVLDSRGHYAELIFRMVNEMQEFLRDGGVSLVAQGMDGWCNVLNSEGAQHAPPIGMPLKERTLGYEALQNGKPQFSIHFNNNPKRLSPREYNTEGATLAIPLLFHDRRQGLVLVYDQNPLIFKESTKHKFINFVRLTSLNILANNTNIEVDQPFLTNEYGAFIPDLWERVIDTELQTMRDFGRAYNSWFGLVTLNNLSSLRTRLRLEDLQQMQKDLVGLFNPSRYGVPGIIGSHSDYVYTFLIQSKDEDAVSQWTKGVLKRLQDPVELSNGIQIETSIKAGFTKIVPEQNDNYQVLSRAKSALSQAMKGSSGN